MGIVIIVIIALLAVGGIYAYANYDPATFNGIINNIPGISTSENKLQDCSIYKKQYSKDFSDNPDNMITGALDGVAKTRACEKYNAQLKKQSEDEKMAVLRSEAEAVNKSIEELAQAAKDYVANTPMRCAEFSQKDFSGYDLRQKDLSWCNLERVNFYLADLTGTKFNSAKLYNANFIGADLTGADLSGADLRTARFNSAKLIGANLQGADLTSAFLNNANLNGANLNGAYLGRADISGAIFTGCTGTPTGQTAGEQLPICTPIPPK